MNKEKNNFKRIWLIYTIGFAVMAAGVFWCFFYYRRSMIWIGSTEDGLVQHLQTLMYYSKWLRGIVKTVLMEHKLSIPTFSFGLGYGDDVLTTLHYYGIGDPFNLFSVFVPVEKIVWLYHILIAVRIYLAGFAFLLYHRYMDRGHVYTAAAYMVGAITYVFSAYGVISCTRHPFFINPMIWFPLILLGCERIRRENRPGIYVISVLLAAVSNFYFLYMIAILTILYVIWREFPVKGAEAWKLFSVRLGKYLLYAAIAGLMSMCILLPVLMRILKDTRVQRGFELVRFFDPVYYLQFLQHLIGTPTVDTWCCLGYCAAGVLCVIWLFRDWKQNQKLCILTLLMTAALLIPFCGYVLNGFAYPSDRWVWAYSLLIGSIVLRQWDRVAASENRKLMTGGVVLAVLALACKLTDDSLNADVSTQLLIAALILLMTALRQSFRKQQIQKLLMIALVIASLANMANSWYSWRYGDRISEYVEKKSLHKTIWKTDAMAVANTGGREEFYRFSGDELTRNMSLMAGLSTTQYFWSMSTPLVNQYMTDLAVSDPKNLATLYQGLDSRTVLNALADVRYFVTDNSENLPYGYRDAPEKKELTGKYQIYKNEESLPFGYTYESVIAERDWKRLKPAAKEQTMLQAAVVADTDPGLREGMPVDSQREFPVTIVPENQETVICEDGRFVVTEEGAQVTLKIKGRSPYNESENLLYIQNLEFQGCTALDFFEDPSVDGYKGSFAVEKYRKMNPVKRAKLRQEKRAAKDKTEVVLSCVFSKAAKHDMGTAEEDTVEKKMYYANARNEFGKGQTEFLLNGGVYQRTDPLKAIRITFPKTGIYTYDEIKVISSDLSDYKSGIGKLKEDTLKGVNFHEGAFWNATNRITGSISLKQRKLLCLSMPFNTGWHAYVDGEKQTILRTNEMFSGLMLEPGDHEIELRYDTPYLKIGMALSLAGVVILILVMVMRKYI